MFQVNNRNTRAKCKLCSKLTIKMHWHLERRHWRRSGIFIVNFIVSVSIVKFEQVNAGWVAMKRMIRSSCVESSI